MSDPGAPTPPSSGQRPSTTQRAALSRELSDFLIEFSIALHKHAMYPGGHPTLAPASEAVARRLVSLLADRGTLSLGVARDQLVIEGVATDPRHPVLHDLADRLHRHHLGAISFARGVGGTEIDASLKLLAEDATRIGGEPLGLRPLPQIASWPHIRLYPLTFDRLQLLDTPEPHADDDRKVDASAAGLQAAQLWVGLARAALASEGAGPAEAPAPRRTEEAPPSEPYAFRPTRAGADGGAPGGDKAGSARNGAEGRTPAPTGSVVALGKAAQAAGSSQAAGAGQATGDTKAARTGEAAGAAGSGGGGGGESGPPLSESEIDAALDAVEPAAAIEAAAAEPAVVAQAIESHERGTAYDQVIVGYMLQIADELKSAGGAGAVALKKRMSKLIAALDQGTLGRLLEMGGDLTQRRQFLLDASQGMAVDAVVDLVRATATSGAPISRSMLRMLTKLGHHAERGPAATRALAETGLREQVAELVRGWALVDPNPDGYASALEKMAAVSPAFLSPGEVQFAPEPLRVLEMACESGGTGPAVRRALDELMASDRVADVLEILERAPRASPATMEIGSRVGSQDAIGSLLGGGTPDFALLDRLLLRAGDRAADPMLDLLAASESRQVRRALIDRLVRIGPALGPHLLPRLGDERWYVVRNLLYLAAELPAPPQGLNAAQFVQHPDFRVRREALRTLFKDAAVRTRAICTALTDPDPRVLRLAVSALSDGGCPEAAVPLVVTIATGDEDSELRVAAVRALATEGGRLALDALLRLTHMRRSLLGNVKRESDEPEFLAALGALGAFVADRRARARLEQAAQSRDPEIVRIATEALKGAP